MSKTELSPEALEQLRRVRKIGNVNMVGRVSVQQEAADLRFYLLVGELEDMTSEAYGKYIRTVENWETTWGDDDDDDA